MRTRACLFVIAVAAVPVSAQSVSLSLAAATTLSVRADVGPVTTSQMLPSGPIAPVGQVSAVLGPIGGYAEASILWQTQQFVNDDFYKFTFVVRAIASAPVPAAGEISAHEVVLMLQSAVPRLVAVDGVVDTYITPGTAGPLLEVDVGDDGIVNFSSAGINTALPVLSVGPSPSRIRIRAGGLAENGAGVATFVASVELLIRPENHVSLTRNVIGCGFEVLAINPAFATDGIRLAATVQAPVFAILGNGLQPILLPSILPACLLMPSPDVSLFVGSSAYLLSIPASVRPITFYAQGVSLVGALELQTTDGYEVHAW